MNRNLVSKFVLIGIVTVGALLTLYPPAQTLKPGIDLAGGTSLIYEIDTQGLKPEEIKNISSNMITILRRRIDPANIQNLLWRPQGNKRFEIQMPLADAKARQFRRKYDEALLELLDENINPNVIMRSLIKPEDQRKIDFERFSQGSDERLNILTDLATSYDQRKLLRETSDSLLAAMKTAEQAINSAGIDVNDVKQNRTKLAATEPQQLTAAIEEIFDPETSQAAKELLKTYIETYSQWEDVTEQLTDQTIGKNDEYKMAQRALNNLNISEDQLNAILALSEGSVNRDTAIDTLRLDFDDRSDLIDNVIAAYDKYKPYKGRLDDPSDLQRMLKGAGILEFRILPTIGHPDVDATDMAERIEILKTKGPRYALDKDYIWCEIESIKKWNTPSSVIGQFGDKYYVLASNQKNEAMLRTGDQKQWKLTGARPTQDNQGRRAIAFSLDEKAGRKLFANITGSNIDRPLCILLDDIAISAPNVQVRIDTSGIITGIFTQEEVLDMSNKLNAGSLPARLIEQPLSVKTIEPSIGADNRDKGIYAGLIGLIIVIICMGIYYTLAGSIADLALLMNLLLVLAMMALIRATFTLPGIAGLILTIGMSVDANVLIFERIREEQQKGSSLRIAIKNGYQKAFRTILDANLTTFLVAAILYWRASEEVKGFAIVLMLGIASSMFTALFVTRTCFDYLLAKKIIKDHLLMLTLLRKPNIDWMKLRPLFLTISSVLMVAGLAIFLTRSEKNNKYDIEFTGGTSVQIDLKDATTSQMVEDKFRQVADELGDRALAAANIYGIGKSGKQFEINTTQTNKISTVITMPQSAAQTPETITAAIKDNLPDLTVTPTDETSSAFTITTSQTNKSIVQAALTAALPDADIAEPQLNEVVNDAILKAFADQLQIRLNLKPTIAPAEKITAQLIDSYPELADFDGGIKITCLLENHITGRELDQRFKDLPFKPEMRELDRYPYKIVNEELTSIADSNQPTNSFIYLSAKSDAGFRELSEIEWEDFLNNETTRVRAATEMATSLPRVTQINPSVGEEAKTKAKVAIILSLFAIVVYVWIRFGTARYGFAAIAALVHDVCITLGAVTACTYIAASPIGKMLLIGDFKITLAIIAAFLTLIGYSLNDTIVIFDRIRENRKQGILRPQMINDSINQTLSRTILTSFTTFIVILIMYIFGGPALRGFTFAIGFGIIIGTYSSVAIAAPMLLLGTKKQQAKA